jgi:hypothetical protein
MIVSLAFATLGGVLAIALPATTYWGALYIGVSTPIVVNTLVKKSVAESGKRAIRPEKSPVNLRSFISAL